MTPKNPGKGHPEKVEPAWKQALLVKIQEQAFRDCFAEKGDFSVAWEECLWKCFEAAEWGVDSGGEAGTGREE